MANPTKASSWTTPSRTSSSSPGSWRPRGYAVSSASDARAGLDMIPDGGYSVVLLDNRFVNSPVVGISMVSDYAAKVPAGWS